jgi:hypothetical protein
MLFGIVGVILFFPLRERNILQNRETLYFCNRETLKTDMDSVAYISSSRKKGARKIAMLEGNQQVQVTPKDRLRSVEEFIDKLEQAVLERV